MGDTIQLKRGPSDKFSSEVTHDGEPVWIKDLDMLYICRSGQDPLKFRGYNGEVWLLPRDKDYKLDDAVGKIWLNKITGTVKLGTTVNGIMRIFSFDDVADMDYVNNQIKNEHDNMKLYVDDRFSDPDTVVAYANAWKTPRNFIFTGDADGKSESPVNGTSDVRLHIDLSRHLNIPASKTNFGHVKAGKTVKVSDGYLDLDYQTISDGKTTTYVTDGALTIIDAAIKGDLNDLASKRGQLGDISLWDGTSANYLKKSGNYFTTNTGLENFPETNHKFYIAVNNQDGNILQTAIDVETKKIYVRYFSSETMNWSLWEQSGLLSTDYMTKDKGGTAKLGDTMLISDDGVLDVDKETIIKQAADYSLAMIIALG